MPIKLIKELKRNPFSCRDCRWFIEPLIEPLIMDDFDESNNPLLTPAPYCFLHGDIIPLDEANQIICDDFEQVMSMDYYRKRQGD